MNNENKGEIVLYDIDETISLEVHLEHETVWLSQSQMAELFGRERSVIAKHISNIFKEGELDSKLVCANFAHTTQHGFIVGKNQTQIVTYYNLDVIISVGYRVKSQRGVLFRQWATKILKDFLLRGYAINNRVEHLEKIVAEHSVQIEFFVKQSLPPQEGVFFNGQIFDAYMFVNDLIRSANTRIVLIDNYIDDTVLTMLDKRNETVEAIIYTSKITKQLQLDVSKHNEQYRSIEVKTFRQSHDRFLIIDDVIYLIGASLKDLGKKWFGFSVLHSVTVEELMNKINCDNSCNLVENNKC